ncbi:MAG TPA: hypothetical protein VKT73_05450 [Xanthobacteraceae bacterium]|nr:hypothetical protein [Xanthobacteraceae bacterium]
MQKSIFLAKLIGPFLAVCGVAMIFNTDAFRVIGEEIIKSPAFIYFAGLFALVAGLAIVNTHNEWVVDWRVTITLLGWLCLIAGVVRLVFPRFVETLGTSALASISNSWIAGEGVVILALGTWLSFKGYGQQSAGSKRRGGK